MAAHDETVCDEQLLVNVPGTMGARYLLVSVSCRCAGTGFRGEDEQWDVQCGDTSAALSTKTLAPTLRNSVRNLIRSESFSVSTTSPANPWSRGPHHGVRDPVRGTHERCHTPLHPKLPLPRRRSSVDDAVAVERAVGR